MIDRNGEAGSGGKPDGAQSSRRLLNDCFQHDQEQLTHAEALALLKSRVGPTAEVERTPLSECLGRVLAEPVVAPRPIPAHDNSAVDGYAFAFDDYDSARGTEFAVVGRAAAGRPFTGPALRGAATRIFTGAVMPMGSDTVAMQEDVTVSGEEEEVRAFIPPGVDRGANRRLAGEDVKAGQTLLDAGARLRPQDVAAIAATGIGEALCRSRLRVAVFSTGDEIIRPGEMFKPGLVYDANGPMLKALAGSMNMEVRDLGVLPDDAGVVRERLTGAAADADVLITSGGVSRGEEDHVGKVLRDLGSLYMWRLAIKPGRPMSFGQIGDCVFMGLPGNPVASFVCFMLYVRPVLVALSGGRWPEPRRFPVKAAFSLRRRAGRREFLRGWLIEGPGGELRAQKYPEDGSGIISSLRYADGLIEIPEDEEQVQENAVVAFIPFGEFGLTRD
jgi:molybdopterin molybdotransferase